MAYVKGAEKIARRTKNSYREVNDDVLCQAVISIAKNLIHYDRIKHVEIDNHFIKEKIEEGIIKILDTPTSL